MTKAVEGTAIDPMDLVRKIKSRGPAPVHLWDPPFCGDMDLLIARDGTWIHEGKPIRRAAMVGLFASVLKREDDGQFYLVTPVEKVRIRVEDCPFVAQEMGVHGQGSEQELEFTTNIGERIVAGECNALMIDVNPDTGEPHPRLHVRNGLNALINRAVFYRLIDLAEQSESDSGEIRTGIWSKGRFFVLDDRGAI